MVRSSPPLLIYPPFARLPSVLWMLHQCVLAARSILSLIERSTLVDFSSGCCTSQAGVSSEQRKLVQKALSLQNGAQWEINQFNRQQTIARFQRSSNDTGSTEVQVAVLTERINNIHSHMGRHHKDKSSQFGLQKLMVRRKRLLKYLARKDYQKYIKVSRFCLFSVLQALISLLFCPVSLPLASHPCQSGSRLFGFAWIGAK